MFHTRLPVVCIEHNCHFPEQHRPSTYVNFGFNAILPSLPSAPAVHTYLCLIDHMSFPLFGCCFSAGFGPNKVSVSIFMYMTVKISFKETTITKCKTDIYGIDYKYTLGGRGRFCTVTCRNVNYFFQMSFFLPVHVKVNATCSKIFWLLTFLWSEWLALILKSPSVNV